MTTETAVKKDIQKLQRAIVDGLEDVKAQDIQVFNTEHLSPLFERVIVASGTSNRQTKALSASVRDSVREAGFSKPRIEGEENGEWIIVDCGPAVVHIMQPSIRQYYHLEDIWGEKPIRLKLGAPKPAQPSAPVKAKPAAKAAKSPGAPGALRRSSAAKTAAREADAAAKQAQPARSAARKSSGTKPSAAGKSVARPTARPASAPASKPAGKPAAKPAARSAAKPAAKTSAKPAAKAPARKTASRPA
jgi:ribosome-associated protein